MLVLPENVTTEVARDTQRMLAQALQQEAQGSGPQLTIDASSLRQFDSAALAVLLECRRLAQAWGKEFVVRNPPKKLAELARLYGIDSLLMPAAQSGVA
jgi:phospholipid transport system transporter-binding protein